MKTYQGSEIRNVAVMGHAHSGKTTFIAAMLHAAKMTPTQGRVADGTAVTAYDEEEIPRGATMQNAVAFAEWQGVKINLVDTPGFHMFSHEARAALLPVEAGLAELPRLAIDRTGAATLRRGQKLMLRGADAPVEGPAYAACFGAPIAFGIVEGGYFVSTRVFNLPG